jgi:hypothetical protein
MGRTQAEGAEQVTVDWRKLRNEGLLDWHSTSKYLSVEIKGDEMGGARGIYGRQEKCIQGFGGGTGREVTTWKT